jgi:hypothetical protein
MKEFLAEPKRRNVYKVETVAPFDFARARLYQVAAATAPQRAADTVDTTAVIRVHSCLPRRSLAKEGQFVVKVR